MNNFSDLDEVAKNTISAQEIINLEEGIKFYKTHSSNWKNSQKNYNPIKNPGEMVHSSRGPSQSRPLDPHGWALGTVQMAGEGIWRSVGKDVQHVG